MPMTIDASVVVALMFDEPMTPHANTTLKAPESFIAPDIIEVEMLSAATKRVRALGMNERLAHTRWLEGRALPIERRSIRPYTDDAFDLSVALDHPSTDCLYLAVAIREDAPLITGDRRLYDRAVESGLGAHVRWLGDFEPTGP